MHTRNFLMVVLLFAVSCTNGPCNKATVCAGDSDCAEAEICRNEACIARGSYCLTDDECPQDQFCNNNYCEAGTRNAAQDAGPGDAGLECAFGTTRCVDAVTIETCEVGKLARVDCSRNGLACRDGLCRPPLCAADAGATRCLDLETQETCATPAVMSDCAAGQVCWKGACSKAAGQHCTTDAECAGGACHCKPGECTGALAAGYCTQVACNTAATGTACPATEECMGLASAGGTRQNLCGQKAQPTCPESTAGLPAGYAGPFKRFFPIPNPANPELYTYGDATCFDRFPLPAGAACAGATECVGGSPGGFAGQCLNFGGTVASGYCTQACDATHACAPGSACAHRTADPAGAGICVLGCSSQLPGLATCDRMGLTCKPAGSGFAIVDSRTDSRGFCFP